MISNTTASVAPTNVANSEQSQIVLFGPASASNTSAHFTVDQQPFFISSFGLGATDTITIYQVFGTGGGAESSTFAPIYQGVVLNQNRSKCRIDYPGRYYLVHAGSTPLGQFAVTGFAATMTHENVSELGFALYSAFENIHPADVIGTAPIIVTGNGTPGTPYDVSLSTTPGSAPPNFVEVTATDPVAVSGNGTAATPYVISTPNIEVQNGGLGNIAIGKFAAASNSSGSAIAIGTNCVAGTAAISSIVMGQAATADGNSDIVIGLNAATSSSSTGGNVCIGTNTGFNATGIIANRNVVIGNPGAATFSSAGTFSSNILIGNQSGLGSGGNFSNTVLIGGGGAFPSSNQIVIGAGGPSTNGGASVSIGGGAFGGNTHASNCVAIGYNAGNNGQSGLYIGYQAGDGNTFANCIALSNSASTTLNPTQANQALLGDSTITQLVTAGSIIQAGAISASDSRLKTNIKDEQNALNTIYALSPVTFKWDRGAVLHSKIPMNEDEYGKQQHGLIAQEVEDILPEIIEDIDRGAGGYKFVRYDRLIPILISAVKELTDRVKELESK